MRLKLFMRENRLKQNISRPVMRTMTMRAIHRLVPVKREVRLLTFTPVMLKNLVITGICRRKTAQIRTNSITMSTKRSVTTVPRERVKEVLSYRFKIPQRATSPTRGITRLTAYDMKTAQTQ